MPCNYLVTHRISVARDLERLRAGRAGVCVQLLQRELSPSSTLESIHGSPPVNVSLDLAHRANRTEDGGHIVITKRPRNAISVPLREPPDTVQAWPSPRTTPHITSPGNGTEMASRNPGHKDTNLSRGSTPSS